MTAHAVAVRQEEPQLTPFEVIERVITNGDLAKMNPQERVAFYWRTCESLGLNPLTRPFEFINLNGKLTMYARKDATDQLRKINGVSVTNLRRERDDELGLITVYATGVDKHGRTDEAEGVVSVKGLSGEAMANAIMKASTKAKRRLTLSLVGLGFLDESEIPEGSGGDVDPTTGEIVAKPRPTSLLEAVQAQQAAMAPSDAPGAEVEAAQLPESTEEPEAASEAEGEVVDGVARAVALSRDELLAGIDEIGVSREYAAQVAKRMFPRGELTNAQRAEVLEALRSEEASL